MAVPTSSRGSTIRKRVSYLGTGFVALGLLLLMTAALPIVENLGNFPAVRGQSHSMILKGFSGSALILIGFVAMTISSIDDSVDVDSEQVDAESLLGLIDNESRNWTPVTQQSTNGLATLPSTAAWPSASADEGICCLQCTLVNPSTANYCNQCGNEIPFHRSHSPTLLTS